MFSVVGWGGGDGGGGGGGAGKIKYFFGRKLRGGVCSIILLNYGNSIREIVFC